MTSSSNIGAGSPTLPTKAPVSAASSSPKSPQTASPATTSAPYKEAQQAKQTQAQPQAQNPFNTPNSALNPQVQFQANQAMQQSKASQPNAAGGSRPVKTATMEYPEQGSAQMHHAIGVRTVLQQANPSNPNPPDAYDITQQKQVELSLPAYQTAKASEEAKAKENASAPVTPTQPLQKTPENVQRLNQSIENGYADTFREAAKTIQFATSQESSPEVINISAGISQNLKASKIYGQLVQNPALGTLFDLTPEDIQQSIQPLSPEDEHTGNPTFVAKQKVMGNVLKYLDQRRQLMAQDPNSHYNQALREYQEATKAAADQGTVIVVANGNDHLSNGFANLQSLGNDTNVLAMSDHVISVGNYDEKTHKMASDSSNGNGRFNPTIAAPGVDVDVPDQANPGHTKKESGTSLSAPKVAGTVAEMKAANPNLTFDQVKNMLRQSATDVAPGEITDGAGLYDPAKAIQLAKEAQPGL